jgi:Concanavalin A-like lectin/glucanases superfamily
MPQLGLGTEIGRVSGGAYDSDALAYFARAGIASGTQTPSSYDNAGRFNGTNQFLSIPSNSTLSPSGSFTFAGWFNSNSVSTFGAILSIGVNAYMLRLNSTQMQFSVINSTNTNSVTATTPTNAVSANTWYFVVGGFDSVTQRAFVSLNNGTIYYSSAVGTSSVLFTATTGSFAISGQFGGQAQRWNGSLASMGFWGVDLNQVTNAVTQLWNNGAGRTYASLDSGLRTNLISWWALNQNSVTADSHGGNNLTNSTNAVTAPATGPIITGYSDSRRLISDFVKGIKSLGLWNSMVCWPLRASQNAGGGTTAFSLGGLGQFNGTLVNAPIWGDDGVSGFLQNSSRRIETSVGYNFSTQNSIFACARKTAAGDLRLVGQSNETPLFVGTTEIRYFNGASAGGTATHPGTNVRSTYSHAFGSSTVVGIVNGGTPVSSAYSPNNLAMQFFIGQGGTNGWVGDISFFAYFSQQIATSTHSQLHSLYRQTLGLGLGLP